MPNLGRDLYHSTVNVEKIIAVLADVPEGLWIREISRRTGLKPMTVSYHVSRNPDVFEENTIEGPKKPVFKFIRLKKGALTKPGIALAKILKEYK